MKPFAPYRGMKNVLPPEMLADLQSRRRGKSTGLALQTLGYAILNPGKKVKILDHHGTRQADRHLANMIYKMVEDLKLQGLVFNQNDNTLVFNLDLTID